MRISQRREYRLKNVACASRTHLGANTSPFSPCGRRWIGALAPGRMRGVGRNSSVCDPANTPHPTSPSGRPPSPTRGEGRARFIIATPAFASGHCQRTSFCEGGNAGRKSLAFLSVNTWRSQCAPPALLSRSVASTFAWPAVAKDPGLGVHHPAALPQCHQPGRRRFPLIPGAHQGSRWKRICTHEYEGGQGEVDRSGADFHGKMFNVSENNRLSGKQGRFFPHFCLLFSFGGSAPRRLHHRSGMDSRHSPLAIARSRGRE